MCSVSTSSVIIQSSIYIKTHNTLGVGSRFRRRSTAPTKPCLLTCWLGGGSPTPPAVCLLSCSYMFTAVRRPKGQRRYPISGTSRSIERIKKLVFFRVLRFLFHFDHMGAPQIQVNYVYKAIFFMNTNVLQKIVKQIATLMLHLL